MTSSHLEAEIRATLAMLTGQDTSGIPLDGDLGSALGLDSLGTLELLAEIEERFDLLIDDIDLGEARTIGNILAIAERHLPAVQAEPV